jgi:hypothetical protein
MAAKVAAIAMTIINSIIVNPDELRMIQSSGQCYQQFVCHTRHKKNKNVTDIRLRFYHNDFRYLL